MPSTADQIGARLPSGGLSKVKKTSGAPPAPAVSMSAAWILLSEVLTEVVLPIAKTENSGFRVYVWSVLKGSKWE